MMVKLCDLPTEVQLKIFSFLDYTDLFSLQETCKELRGVCSDGSLLFTAARTMSCFPFGLLSLPANVPPRTGLKFVHKFRKIINKTYISSDPYQYGKRTEGSHFMQVIYNNGKDQIEGYDCCVKMGPTFRRDFSTVLWKQLLFSISISEDGSLSYLAYRTPPFSEESLEQDEPPTVDTGITGITGCTITGITFVEKETERELRDFMDEPHSTLQIKHTGAAVQIADKYIELKHADGELSEGERNELYNFLRPGIFCYESFGGLLRCKMVYYRKHSYYGSYDTAVYISALGLLAWRDGYILNVGRFKNGTPIPQYDKLPEQPFNLPRDIEPNYCDRNAVPKQYRYKKRLSGTHFEKVSTRHTRCTLENDVVLFNDNLVGYMELPGALYNNFEMLIRVDDLIYGRLD